jgi:flagellar motor switch protein FliN/FliY
MPDPAPPPSASFVQAWATSLAQALGQIAGSAFPCVVENDAPAELAATGSGDLWIAAAWSGGLRGEMSLRMPPDSALRLAQIFTSEPYTPGAELASDHAEAALELLRQIGGLVCSALKSTWGEVQLRIDRAAGAPSWPASSTAWLRAGEPPEVAFIEMQLSAALAAALRTERAEPAKPPAAVPPPSPPEVEGAGNAKLELLMDVELAVTLRFGSRKLLLREVLDLIPGAVVELDRQADEPVDVILDGRVVARGELVVLDGNYGVRVTEVARAGG